jgi:hypothetical protein
MFAATHHFDSGGTVLDTHQGRIIQNYKQKTNIVFQPIGYISRV